MTYVNPIVPKNAAGLSKSMCTSSWCPDTLFPFSPGIWVRPCDSPSQWKMFASVCHFQVWPIKEKKRKKANETKNKTKALSAHVLLCSFPFCLLDVNAPGNLGIHMLKLGIAFVCLGLWMTAQSRATTDLNTRLLILSHYTLWVCLLTWNICHLLTLKKNSLLVRNSNLTGHLVFLFAVSGHPTIRNNI